MHIPDGFLAPTITVPAYAVAAPLWAWAVRRHFAPGQVEALPAVGALTAVAFVLQTIMIPVPGGTSTHVVGAGLLAMLHGPLLAFVCESLVLLLQALFFGAGGITVLGVNALAMGLAGPLVAWGIYKGLRRRGAFVAAYVGLQVSTVVVALTLGLQHRLSPEQFPTPFPVMLAAMLLPSLTIAGAIEGLYTVFAIRVLGRARGRGEP